MFLLELCCGMCLLLPLVGRRNAGPKFYRLILVISGALVFGAAISHLLAGVRGAAMLDVAAVAAIGFALTVLRFPRRIIYSVASALLAAALIASTVYAYQVAVKTTPVMMVAGSLSSAAILGSVMLAMLLGHWYLVVRGMPIEPLMRLTKAFLIATVVKLIVVVAALVLVSPGGFEYGSPLHRVMVGQGIFFWMRIGWGLVGPLVLYPMIWGTVKIRSTMAATGILYVAVVAVIIGEVLGSWLSAIERMPL